MEGGKYHNIHLTIKYSYDNKIDDNQRASAIDAIHDMLFGKASQAMADYKQVVANTFFDEPTETEIPNNETDNGTD